MQYTRYLERRQIRLLPADATVLVFVSHEVLVPVFHSHPQGKPG
jgi:hypothetical protein